MYLSILQLCMRFGGSLFSVWLMACVSDFALLLCPIAGVHVLQGKELHIDGSAGNRRIQVQLASSIEFLKLVTVVLSFKQNGLCWGCQTVKWSAVINGG